jgi:two-component system, NtrC family, nitrogen regulation sensor histidine kinase NtrY
MGFRGFRLNVLVRLLLLAALLMLFAWSIVATGWQLTPLIAIVLAVLVAIELVRYVESVNRELTGFLQYVAHHDFSASIPIAEKGRVFRELESAYKQLAGAFRKLNRDKAVNHRYLEALVEHVSTALVCLDDAGTVQLMNRQAKVLFQSPHLHGTRSFARIDPELPATLAELQDGDRTLVQVSVKGERLQLALFATEFELLGRRYKLISFQNIRDELEQREIDFSRRMISVLTHEIMNSVTPMIALSKVIEKSLIEAREHKQAGHEPKPEDDEELLQGAASIRSRGAGLLHFVEAYSRLSNLPRPTFTRVEVGALLEQVCRLMAAMPEADEMTLETQLEDPGLCVQADAEQLQQVLINLVKNAVEALAGRPDGKIRLVAAHDDRDRALIRVIDNGPGIDPVQLENVFVPFFTTKRHGTGVGLSVSRQIMLLNKGLLSVRSVPGQGCEFTLRFR